MKILILILFFITTFNTHADDSTILLSASKVTPRSGDTITLVATPSESIDIGEEIYLIKFIGDSKFGDFVEEPISVSPYQWSITIPITVSGLQRYTVSGKINGTIVDSNEVEIVIQPDFTQLRQILFSPGSEYIMILGQTKQLEVVGRFSDGNNHLISRKILGTTYSENIIDGLTIIAGDSPVISVSEDGLVTALQPGVAEVVATNNGISNVRRIKVVPNPNPTNSIPGDFDLDGDVDRDDLINMLTNIRSRFGTKVTGSDDPYDMNKDGIINMLDFIQFFRLLKGF